MVKRILNIGVLEGYSDLQNQKIRIFNAVTYLTILGSILISIFLIFEAKWDNLLIQSTRIIFAILSIFLIHKHEYKTSVILFFIMAFATSLWGGLTIAHQNSYLYLFFLLVTASFYFLNSTTWMISISVLSAAAFIILKYFGIKYQEPIFSLSYAISLVLIFGIYTSIALLFIKEHIAYQRKLQLKSQELENKNEEQKELIATNNMLFSIISHDLKAPMGSIIGISEILISKEYDLNKQNKLLSAIHKSSSKNYELLNNLLCWSSSQSGTLTASPGFFNLSDIIEEIKSLYSSVLEQKEISLLNFVNPKVKLFADTKMISTIIRNLIFNAIKFSHKGGKIEVDAYLHEGKRIITVKDYGVGINYEQKKNLFSLDSEKSTQGTNNENGSGLGLLLCKDFIEKNNGEIWFESVEDKGSVFFISLPNRIDRSENIKIA